MHENYSSVLSSGRRQLRSSHFAEVLRFSALHLFVDTVYKPARPANLMIAPAR